MLAFAVYKAAIVLLEIGALVDLSIASSLALQPIVVVIDPTFFSVLIIISFGI